MQAPPGNGHPRNGTTIVAPATPGGEGAISVVRLSGPDAFRVVFLLTGLDPRTIPARSLTLCRVRDVSGALLDTALAVFFPAPNSFTGEDMAEVHLHGNPLVVEAFLGEACAAGAVPAEPGEFSRRAFLNGKMDLTQAEGLADLISARTSEAARAALRQLRGGVREAVALLREKLFSLLTVLEAAIDFPEEEETGGVAESQLEERVYEIITSLEELLGTFDTGRRFRDGATVAIAGAANVGKSTLLNRLAGEERAIVTEVPGTTRDYLQAEGSLRGVPVRWVDTAGLRKTGDPVEREGVRRTLDVIAEADVVLFLLDGSRAVAPQDREAYAEVAGRPHFVVWNKADLPQVEAVERFEGAGKRGEARVSAKTGKGMEELLAAAAREVTPGEGGILAHVALTRLRHRQAVAKAVDALSRAGARAGGSVPLEFRAEDVREAAQALGELLGEIAPEEVLDAIFSEFCIGK